MENCPLVLLPSRVYPYLTIAIVIEGVKGREGMRGRARGGGEERKRGKRGEEKRGRGREEEKRKRITLRAEPFNL